MADCIIPEGYKETVLGVIPKEWEVKRLGEICSYFKSGECITSKDISVKGKYPVYGGNGLRGYTDKKYTHDGAYVLIGRQGALCGNINYVIGKCYISEHAIAVQTQNNLLWLRYKLDFWNLNRYSESSAQPGLSVEKLTRYKLALPPLEEQCKIAEVLSVWDKAIEKQTQLIEKLELRKKGLMQQLLTGKKRLPDFSDLCQRIKLDDRYEKKGGENNKNEKINQISLIPQGYKSTTLGIIPQEWEVKRLGDIAQCFSGGTPKAGKNEYYDGNIPFIRSGEIHQKDTELFLSELGMAESSSKMVHKGDLLMALYGANSGDVSISQINGAINQAILCIRPRNVLVPFLCPFLDLNKDMYIAKYLQGGQGNLSGEIALNYKIPVPPMAEQLEIVDVLTTADREIELAQQRLESLRQQKHGLMQQLLTGKKRVKI